MDWPDALEIVVARTRHERFRALCAADHPRHSLYRARVVQMATGAAPPAGDVVIAASNQPTPALGRQAASLIDALARTASALVRGEAVLVPAGILDARLAACEGCPLFDRASRRCGRCGCFMDAKARLATERCPLDPPRWGRFPATPPPSST